MTHSILNKSTNYFSEIAFFNELIVAYWCHIAFEILNNTGVVAWWLQAITSSDVD